MKDLLRKTRCGMMVVCAVVALSVLFGTGRVWALPAVQFDVFFSPSADSTFARGQLQGTLHVQDEFLTFDPFSDVTTITQDSFFDVGSPEYPIDPCTPTDPCRTIFDVMRPPNPNAPLPISSFFSFTGNIVGEGLGDPVYAFSPGTTEATAHPPDPGAPSPLISICIPTDPCRVDITDIVAPLYAFSNATQVGYIRARITEVPEPSTLLLLGSGLIATGIIRRRSSRK